MKRIFLLIVTNLAVMLVLGIVASLLGVNRYLTANGLNLSALLGFAAVMGFGGAFISLLISKPMAKWTTGAQVITQPQSADEAWLVDTVRQLSQRAQLEMPEVAIYEGEPNAFATGAFRNSALVAVSTGLLQGMTREEVEAVLAHEVAHIQNGDMVTLTLVQGVLNTFVVFLSRVIGYAVDSALRKNDEEYTGPGIGYYVTSIVLDWTTNITSATVADRVVPPSTIVSPSWALTVVWAMVVSKLGERITVYSRLSRAFSSAVAAWLALGLIQRLLPAVCVIHPASVSTRTSLRGLWRLCSRLNSTSAARQRNPLPESSDGLPSALISFICAVPSGATV